MKRLTLVLVLFVMAAGTLPLHAHCEIPCGIYGDSLRFAMIREHVQTIEKSMEEIESLSKMKKPDYHQMVRWISNKEEHAQMLQDIVSRYFLHQRIKPVPDGAPGREAYLQKIELMHRLLVAGMKCKQGTDKADTQRILDDLALFETIYWQEHGHKH